MGSDNDTLREFRRKRRRGQWKNHMKQRITIRSSNNATMAITVDDWDAGERPPRATIEQLQEARVTHHCANCEAMAQELEAFAKLNSRLEKLYQRDKSALIKELAALREAAQAAFNALQGLYDVDGTEPTTPIDFLPRRQQELISELYDALVNAELAGEIES